MEQQRWKVKPICPHCEHNKVYRYNDEKLFKCAKCRKQFTVRVGIIFEDSHLPLRKWLVGIYLITAHKKGIASLQLAKDLRITQKSALFLLHRIRYAIHTGSFKAPLENIVEADETYIGGKILTNIKDKKIKGTHGKCVKDKTLVFGLIERQGELCTTPVLNVSKKTLQTIINKNVSKDAILMTDEWTAYKGLEKNFKGHSIVPIIN